jgi:carboxyl-terminal processing protease
MAKYILRFSLGLSIFLFSLLSSYSLSFSLNQESDIIKQILNQTYVDEITFENNEEENKKTEEEKIEEIFERLDPYTKVYTKEELEKRMNYTNYKKIGIGVLVNKTEDGFVQVLDLYDGGAKDAGVESGDLIVRVGSEFVMDHSLPRVIEMISGEVGSFVDVLVFRESKGMIEKRIERKMIRFPAAYGSVLSGNIGYLQIATFSEDLMKDVLKEMKKMDGVDSYIIDLRNNTGGYIDSAKKLLGMFPKVKTAYLLDTKDFQKERFQTIKQQMEINGSVALLVNQYSASASELVAGAFKDYGVGKIYGQNTFGKGSMQGLFQLDDGSGDPKAIFVTVARFFSPKGNTIDIVGIQPDLTTEPGGELLRAHEGILNEKFLGFEEIDDIRFESTNEGILVRFSSEFNLRNRSRRDFSLVQIGREKFDYKIRAMGKNTLLVEVASDFSGRIYVDPRSGVDEIGRYGKIE